MTRHHAHRIVTAAACSALILGALAAGPLAQRITPADAAAKLTGTWKINFELSPAFRPKQSGAYRSSGSGPLLAISAVRPMGGATAFQRGGGRGGGAAAPQTAGDRAAQEAVRGLQQVPDSMTIKASADSVTFTDARGERTYVVNDKNTKLDLNGAEVTAKSKWDKNSLKQEFVSGETKVNHTWEMNDEGTRLNFRMVIQSFSSTGPFREARAVYDKQP